MYNEFQTLQFDLTKLEKEELRIILEKICNNLDEKGYKYKDQILGYLLSGDLAYIPRYNDSRNMIRKIGRDKIIIELLEYYISNK